MVRTFLSALLTLLLIHTVAKAGQHICPAINFGPYGSGTYMYYAILHDDSDTNCDFGTPVMYIGGPGEEAYCAGGIGNVGCIALGGAKTTSTKAAVDEAVKKSNNKCFTQIPQAAPNKIDFSAPFLPDHAFDSADPQFRGQTGTLGFKSSLTRQKKTELQGRFSWKVGNNNAVVETVKTTLVRKKVNLGTGATTEEDTSRDVGLGVECNANDAGLPSLTAKSVTLAVGYRTNAAGQHEAFQLRSGNKLDGVLMVVSDSGGIYYVRVNDTAAWGHP